MPGLTEIASVFVRFGNLTLGGGSATIAVLHREIVEHRGWVTEEWVALCFALSRLTPGTNLLAFCTGVGWVLQRGAGAVVALLAASIPCALIVVAVTMAFSSWQTNSFAQAAIQGAVAAAVSITVKTCWTLAKPHFKVGQRLRALVTGGVAFALHVFAGLPAVEVLLLAAAAGCILPSPAP